MDEKIVLRMENVTMQFGGVVAVNNLSLDVPDGKIVALIGPNGAGKSTLGYALMDLDGNGNKELIITDGNVIYDLYILLDDGPGHLLSSWERNAYYLCDGNAIQNVGSNSAASSLSRYPPSI